MDSVDFSSITDAFVNHQLYDDGIGETFPAAQPVCGRSKETLALLKSYQRLLQTSKTQTVFVHGESGSGKTVLVDQLRQIVCDSNGYFVAGKYFQNAAVQEPHSALMAAFSDLCDLVIQSDDFDDHVRQDISQKLKADAQLLVRAISSLSPLVGSSISHDELVQASSIGKFKAACRAFLHTMASKKHPVVVFLDDIQWADEGSRQLIAMFLQDSELKNVMFIFASRDKEDEKGLLAGLQSHILEPTEITLSNLDGDGVHQMITSILGASTNQIKILSDLVNKRTRGNPLHVVMFMEAIQQEKLLKYNRQEQSWTFDVPKIQQEIMISATLADLLGRKIKRLSIDMKQTLTVASLLGYSFDESILLRVACNVIENPIASAWYSSTDLSSQNTVLSSLSAAAKEGFIEKTSRGYQFTHDKLQSAFESLNDQSSKDQLHLLLGEDFLANRANEKSYIYKAAVHLNNAPGFLNSRQQRIRLTRINLEAAKYCVEVSAFGDAVIVLKKGLGVCSPIERWSEEQYELTNEMMEALARAQFIVGEFDDCRMTTSEALSHAQASKTKIKFQLIEVEVRMAENKVECAILTASQALRTLGVHLPRKAKLRHVIAKLLKVKVMLGRKTDDDILNLPITDDPLVADAVRLLMHVCSYCLLKDETDTAVLSALLATELTLKNGLSQHSSCAFAIYGVAEVSLGNIGRAYRFGKLALTILARMHSKEAECATVGYALTMLSFYREPANELAAALYQASDSGYRYGDIIYATFCVTQSYVMHLNAGMNLSHLEGMMRATYHRISDIAQETALLWLQPGLHYVLTMRSEEVGWDHCAILSGEIMNEGDYFHEAMKVNHNVLVVIGFLWKAKLAGDFGQFSLAALLFECCKPYGTDAICFSHGSLPYYWDLARVNYSLFDISRQRRHLKKARKYKRLLQRMVATGCSNASPRLAYLVAQETSVLQKFGDDFHLLRAAYDHGITRLVEMDDLYLEGLLNEMAAFDFAKRGLRIEADGYFDRALHIYLNEWGAIAKYKQLTQKRMQMSRGVHSATPDLQGNLIELFSSSLRNQ